jgi:hypothetical protein
MWLRQSRTEVHQSGKIKIQEAPKESESTPACQALLENSSRQSLECEKSLIEILGTERLPQIEGTMSQISTSKITEIVLSSRLGMVLLVLIQLTLLGGTCVILYFDVITIGIVRGVNWLYALLSLAFYVGSSWLVMMVASPFGRLGRDPFEYDVVDSNVSGDPQEAVQNTYQLC